jgi:Lipocalin-like domain
MRRFRNFTITRIVLLVIGFILLANNGQTQEFKELVGAWTLVSITVNQGGQKKIEPFGPAPKGSLIFESNSRFSIAVTRSDLPKLGSNSRVSGTAEENAAIVQGTIAYFGTYSVSAEDHLVTIHVEGSTFPNWVGTDQKRLFTIIGDELRYTDSNRSSGEGTALVVWKRVK